MLRFEEQTTTAELSHQQQRLRSSPSPVWRCSGCSPYWPLGNTADSKGRGLRQRGLPGPSRVRNGKSFLRAQRRAQLNPPEPDPGGQSPRVRTRWSTAAFPAPRSASWSCRQHPSTSWGERSCAGPMLAKLGVLGKRASQSPVLMSPMNWRITAAQDDSQNCLSKTQISQCPVGRTARSQRGG